MAYRLLAVGFLVGALTALPLQADTLRDEPVYAIPAIVITPYWQFNDSPPESASVTVYTGQQLDNRGIRGTDLAVFAKVAEPGRASLQLR